jgi:hypothetical protein
MSDTQRLDPRKINSACRWRIEKASLPHYRPNWLLNITEICAIFEAEAEYVRIQPKD